MPVYRWLRALLALMLGVLLLGAAVPGAAGPVQEAGHALPATGEYPLAVTDSEGRSVTIRARPQRIIAMAPSITEILFALGAGDRIVGVDTYSDYPEAARNLPRIGDLLNPNYEAMVAARPDLVFAIGGSRKMWEKLDAAGVPVVVLQPASLRQVMQAIELVGRVIGASAEAARVVREMERQLEEIQVKLGYTAYRPRVFWEIWHDPLISAGPGAFMDDLIRLAGGINLAGNAGTAWPEVSLEAIVAADPEIILTSDREWARKVLAGDLPAWAGTTAVRRGNVIVVDDDLTHRPGPRMIAGLEQVASALHPLLFWIWTEY